VRELREFRVHHDEFRESGIAVAGVSRDPPDTNRRWVEDLGLSYPMLTDPGGAASRSLGLVNPVGVGTWTIELFRRTTLLIDVHGNLAAVWGKVKIRGHAEEVLKFAKASRFVA